MSHFAPYRPGVRVIAYVPLDGDFVDSTFAAYFREVDALVTYTEWARCQFAQAFQSLPTEPNQSFPPIEIIGHGVDCETYFILTDQSDAHERGAAIRKLKQEVFGDPCCDNDSFIVLNGSRPTPRKRMDLTIRGFAEFAKGKPEGVKLCLHCAHIEQIHRDEFASLAEECGISDRLIVNPLNPNGGPISEQDLNRLYGACDVGINTSMGEGWGLVSFEHAATGAAQIVPRHTACGELWAGAAEIIEPAHSYVPEFSPLRMGEVAVGDVATALERLYRDEELAARLGKAGQRLAQSYDWATVADHWRRILLNLASTATK